MSSFKGYFLWSRSQFWPLTQRDLHAKTISIISWFYRCIDDLIINLKYKKNTHKKLVILIKKCFILISFKPRIKWNNIWITVFKLKRTLAGLKKFKKIDIKRWITCKCKKDLLFFEWNWYNFQIKVKSLCHPLKSETIKMSKWIILSVS